MKQRIAVNQTVHEVSNRVDGHRGSSRGGKFAHVDALLDESKGPLDDEEQEQLIREFEHLHLEQTRTYRVIFGAVGLVLAAFFAWAAFEQHVHPFEQRFTGELRAAIPSSVTVQLLLVIQALALTSTSAGMLQRLPPKGQREKGCMPATLQQWMALRLGLVGSLICCCSWVWAHSRMVQMFGWTVSPRWDLLWIPLAPLTFAASCLWVVSSLDHSAREVALFRGAKYNLKQV
mmetsp:Transcript_14182/g.37782  ORF Transcript_14182/g.37782 Transcript_14182/m.37782 type:complete len:232 (+) Transcript_14182:113-808(+)